MPLVNRRPGATLVRTAGTSLAVLALLVAIVAVSTPAVAATSVDHVLRWNADDYSIQRDGDAERILVDGASTWSRAGRPELPRASYSYVVPVGTRAEAVELVDAEWVDVDVTSLATGDDLVSSDGTKAMPDPFVDAAALERSNVYPPVPVTVGASHPMRGWSVASVDVVPVRVGADGRVQRLASARVRLTLGIDPRSNDTVRRTVEWSGLRDRDAALVRAVVENPADVDAYAPSPGVDPSTARFDFEIGVADDRGLARVARIVPEPVDMLVITNDELRPEFERLAAWRTQEGLRTSVVTTDEIVAVARPGGDLQETLRNYIRTAYQQWGVSYLLLGGDAEILPPRYARSSFYPQGGFTDVPADLYFAALDGNWNIDGDGIYAEPYKSFLETGDEADLLAEIAIGRVPVKNLSQAADFVDKVIAYENPTDRSYVGRALFMSEVLFPQAWNPGDSITLDGAIYSEDIVFDSIIGGGNLMQSWRMYENTAPYVGSILETKQAALDSMSTGNFGIVNHVGHGFYYNMSVGVGDQNIFVPDVDTSVNNAPDRPFLLHALNCSSGAFDFDCLLERFVQIEGGAVGSIGASRAAFPSTANVYQQSFYREIFVNGNVRVGDAQLVSRSEQVAITGVEGSHRWTHFGYHVFTDPALRVWREEPRSALVSAPSSVLLGASDVTVDVSASGAVEGATVALTRPDGGFAVGETDASGQVTLSLDGLADRAGSIDLVVTQGLVFPVRQTIEVQSGANGHVRATPASVFDGSGDGDGLAEAGETIEWGFDFVNQGGADLGSVSLQLQPIEAPNITPVQLTRSLSGLTSGQAKSSQPFIFAIGSGAEDGRLLRFEVVMSSGGETWRQPVQLLVGAPEIDVARILWDDSVTGDGDGVIDEGETFDLVVEVANYGGAAVNALDATLTSPSSDVQIDVGTATAPAPIGTREVGTITGLRVTESNVTAENPLELTLTDDEGRVVVHTFDLRRPGAPPAPTLDTTFGPDRIVLRTEAIAEPSVRGHRVYRRADGEASFSEVFFDTIDGTGFIEDADLASLTRYSYRITYVDSTGVESDPSPIVSASTAPPQLEGGFPLPVTRELAGPIAVGNMVADGTKVATFGADYLYALDANGDELVNGDNDSQTRGPLAGPQDARRFTPSGVAMADLDGDGLDELIGTNWENFEVWVVDANGDLLPGWPQTMNQKAWATPVVADLDADGDFEIITNNTNRTTYVWHHDGTELIDGDDRPETNGVFQLRDVETFGRTTPAVYDVDGNGTLEIILPTSRRDGVDNLVQALQIDGTNAPGWPQNVGPNGWTVSHPTIADVEGDGEPEIFLVTENDLLHAWHPDGSVVSGYPKPLNTVAGARDSKHPAVSLADFDRDGQLELVTVAINSLSSCDVYVQELDGTVLPGWPRSLPGLSESSPIIGDVNGDLSLDIVFGIGGGTDNTPNQLYAMNLDGTDVQGFPITLPGAVRAVPVVDDFDGDGDVDIVYAGFDLFLHVWDMPFPFYEHLAPWPTFQVNNRRTGVFLEDQATSAVSAIVDVRAGVEGMMLETRFTGGAVVGIDVVVDRRAADADTWTRVADDLRLEGPELTWVDASAVSGESYVYRIAAANGAFAFESSAVTVPTRRLALKNAVPNPFNPSTTVVFEIPGTAGARVPTVLELYDVTGRRVRTLLSAPLGAGEHRVTWDGTDERGQRVASGAYFARLSAAGQNQTMKLMLVK